MSLLHRHMEQQVTFIRDGKETEATVWVQSSRKIVGPYELDVRRGDVVQYEDWHEPHIVKSAKHGKNPIEREGHTTIDIVPQSEWSEQITPAQHTSITQHIGSAAAVAGRDVTGPITVNITAAQLFQELEQRIEADPAIPAEEKKTLLAQLKNFAANSYVTNMVTSMVWDGTKAVWTWATQS